MSRIFEAMGVHMVAPADGENKQLFYYKRRGG